MGHDHSHDHSVALVNVTQPNPVPPRFGVHVANGGLDVSVVARLATHVDFCVLGDDDSETRYALIPSNEGIWHGHINGLGVGTRYGFRADGPWDPDRGFFYNPAKFLLDPYGRGLEGSVDMSAAVYGHIVDENLYPTSYPFARSPLDSRGHVPCSVVVDSRFPVAPKPRIPWEKTIVYEVHVKGFTKNMPGIPGELQGTYAGLAHPASVDYLKNLGITSIELLPVHAKCEEPFLSERGLTNYWGYSTLNFFTPEPSYATHSAQERGAQAVVDEFRGMVSILHEAGIEVILDVVYNHTCEGGDAGPSLSWRGLDSDLYYRHTNTVPVACIDDTGTGNTVNVDNPKTMSMILDSLRYWADTMGVDGFRFDLAATLGRFATGFNPKHPLLMAMATDRTLSTAKLIAEPWDIGPGGWQTGNFPLPFSEWNDHYRGALRSFWLSDVRSLVEGHAASGPNNLATRLAGSRPVFDHGTGIGRGPRASINFITAHDGFTLADLTAFDTKHNWANLEGNRDGSNDNRSWNHGIEGWVASIANMTDDEVDPVEAKEAIETTSRRRYQTQRNLLTSLLISAGTPMILGGDEFSRTQQGNNNAYCQDSPISWFDWNLTPEQLAHKDFVRWLIGLRQAHPVLRPDVYESGAPVPGDSIPDVAWLDKTGAPMPTEGWALSDNRVFQMLRSGVRWNDRDALVIVNGALDEQEVSLPTGHGVDWLVCVDTAWIRLDEGVQPGTDPRALSLSLGQVANESIVTLRPNSMQVLLSDIAVPPKR